MSPAVDLGDGVVLRDLRSADAAPLAAAYRRNREHLAPWEPERAASWYDVETQDVELTRHLRAAEAGAARPLVLVAGEEVVGRVTLSAIVRSAFQSTSLGYWIDVRYTRRGLMTAAVRTACAIARDELGLHRVQAGTLLHNEASQRVLLACGFEPIGVAPEYLQIAGRWQDHRLFQRILHD